MPTLRYRSVGPRLLSSRLTLNGPGGLPAAYPDLIGQLHDPVVMARLFQQAYEADQYRRLFDYTPPARPDQPYTPPSPTLQESEPSNAVGTTLSAVMAHPQVQQWLFSLEGYMARRMGVSRSGFQTVEIILASVAGGTGILLYETGQIESLPQVTIPFRALSVQVEYRKSFMINLELPF
ncbi:hypothetical protein [Larkinella soli]|uniref:hypothetical protein n=1 Tax=Larkinella soli TaxID=1770527 RepID=UPI000FFB5548|nr:hypothetical protein [Larkinella soli]